MDVILWRFSCTFTKLLYNLYFSFIILQISPNWIFLIQAKSDKKQKKKRFEKISNELNSNFIQFWSEFDPNQNRSNRNWNPFKLCQNQNWTRTELYLNILYPKVNSIQKWTKIIYIYKDALTFFILKNTHLRYVSLVDFFPYNKIQLNLFLNNYTK